MSNTTTIHQAQEQVDQWIKTVGVKYFSELTNLGILMEEVGELSRIMVRKFGDQSFKNKEEEVLLADEMADVLFVLVCLANQTGIDLATAFEKNIQKKTLRDSSRHQNNATRSPLPGRWPTQNPCGGGCPPRGPAPE
jgi:NTP pyrophosphatase (non-canonical NTP hydrolase)